MEDKVNEILALLKENDKETKKAIILECAVKVGSEEWAEAVKDFMKRMENINKKE